MSKDDDLDITPAALRELLQSCTGWPKEWDVVRREDYIEMQIARLVLHE